MDWSGTFGHFCGLASVSCLRVSAQGSCIVYSAAIRPLLLEERSSLVVERLDPPPVKFFSCWFRV